MSEPQYAQEYATDPNTAHRQVVAEVDHHATDWDPGQGNIGGPSYGGMPDVPNPPNYRVPDTFDQANPGLSYTRPRDRSVVYVRTQPARSHRTRNYIIPIVGDPIMILGRNPQRWKAVLSAAAAGIFVADDGAGLQGISATNPGNAFALPTGIFTYESVGELFAFGITAPIVLSVLEYIDD